MKILQIEVFRQRTTTRYIFEWGFDSKSTKYLFPLTAIIVGSAQRARINKLKTGHSARPRADKLKPQTNSLFKLPTSAAARNTFC